MRTLSPVPVGTSCEGSALQLAGLHLNGVERAGGGDVWGRERKKAQAKGVLRLDEEFMADVGWWR